jgi:hypothetical protein
MLLSTLPEPPGMTFEVKGVVIAQGVFASIGGAKVPKMMDSLIEQARNLGADGIVDFRTALGGEVAVCVMTGTAVKILR